MKLKEEQLRIREARKEQEEKEQQNFLLKMHENFCDLNGRETDQSFLDFVGQIA